MFGLGDKNSIVRSLVAKFFPPKKEKPKEPQGNVSAFNIKTPYNQLTQKNDVVRQYPNITKGFRDTLYGSRIEDKTNQRQSSKTDYEKIKPIAEQIPRTNKIVTYGKVNPDVLLHETAHRQFDVDNPQVPESFQVASPKAKIFDEKWDERLKKKESSASLEIMKSIDKHLNRSYTNKGEKAMQPSFERATERFAYLSQNPQFIPKELRPLFSTMFKNYQDSK